MNEFHYNRSVELKVIQPAKKTYPHNIDNYEARPIGSGKRGKNRYSLPDGMSLSTGCKIYPDCLTCPLPKCIYDEALVTQLAKSELGKIFELYDQGWSYLKIARRTGHTFTTIRLILSAKRDEIDEVYTKNEFLLGYKSK